MDALLDKVEDDVAEEIRNILVTNEHLKLSRRFTQFILKYLDDDYYKAISVFPNSKQNRATIGISKGRVGFPYTLRKSTSC